MSEYLFYCRSGYESDLLAELDDKLGRRGHYGFANFKKDSAVLRYQLVSERSKSQNTLTQASSMIDLKRLIFARQKCAVLQELAFVNLQDRVGELVSALERLAFPKDSFGDLRVEYADTEDGKEMAKFCKKFTVPLRAALRKQALLSKAVEASLPYLHVFFEHGGACLLAVSFPHDRSEEPLGVKRLKFPSEAPSRSTLKLEEAIQSFCSPAQQSVLFQTGMSAVDLGACPGGWTYQLVSRGIKTEAVDNGAMDETLMQSGLVEYSPADGFTYKPKEGHVDWLVCDMIEKPDRVAKLMADWLTQGLASAAIFNLKLPMKKRYLTLVPLIQMFEERLSSGDEAAVIHAKHLYHNRDEVTFMMIKNSQMCNAFVS
jgi:23S rRNA (cytidine2498-2'-O)-methyltransferase